MNYYNEIKNRLIDNEIYSKVNDYSNRLVVEFERKLQEKINIIIKKIYYKLFLFVHNNTGIDNFLTSK